MFQVIELNDKPLSELKEIAKKIGVKADVTKKQDLISSIVDAQTANPDLAATLSKEFPSKVKAVKAAPKAEDCFELLSATGRGACGRRRLIRDDD